MSVSVLILTYNEEVNLPDCLKALSWSDDVVVFDSFSTDRTVAIAESGGARVLQRKFDNYGAQREAARMSVGYKHPWVLAIDADERPDEELITEMQAIACQTSTPHAAYRMRRKDHFMGKWVKYSTLYPSWFVRFYRPEKVCYEARAVHEYPTVEGAVGELGGHLLHYSFNKGLGDWWSKHIKYAYLEAVESLRTLENGRVDWMGLLSIHDPVRRRRALKGVSCRLPLRPTLRFLYMYVLRGGLLDGWAGLTYCRLIAMYEYITVLNMIEIRRRQGAGDE